MPQEHLGALAAHLAHWVRRLMPPGPRQDTLTTGLEQVFGDRRDPVTAGTCRELELHCQKTARHLELHFDPDGTAPPDEHAPGWPPPDPAAVRRRAGGIAAVLRRDDGSCEIRIDGLEPVGYALPYLQAAFDLAREASSLVLDLRNNGGGDPGTVAVIAGRLLGERTPGAADHVTPVRLSPRVLGLLPEATVVDAVTGTNWEQTGVRAGP
ncbi:hypothetical protein ACQP2X_20820 [Actinoplanes sp. CA-131856]